MNNSTFDRRYIVVTLFHAGGDANNHPAIFAAYAGSGIWTAVHTLVFDPRINATSVPTF